MKKLLPNILILALLLGMNTAFAQNNEQERYLDLIFDDVTVSSNVKYGENYSIMPIILGEDSVPQVVDLVLDVYEPKGDTATNRPIFLIVHAGDFLPAGLNLTPYGGKKDSAVVAFATNMARRGFVGVSLSYRQGWNPTSNDETTLRRQILEASVRATQDIHNAIRFFKWSVAEDGNPFGVDPTKVAIGGEDASTYAATNVAFLKDLSQASIPKFLDFNTMPPTPFVDSLIFGNVYGTKPGLLNIPNYPEYTSEISLMYGLVGGLGEFSWIEEGDPAVVGIQNIHTFESLGIRSETVGSGASLRILVDAAYMDTVVARSVELGNNAVFEQANFQDPITQLAMERSGGLPGMLVLNTPIREGSVQCDPSPGVDADNFGRNGDPWGWYNETIFKTLLKLIYQNTDQEAEIRNCRYKTGNPNDPALAKTYVDTISAYLAPRMVVAMGIPGTSVSITTDLNDELADELGLKTYPNPADEVLNLSAEAPIRSIEMTNLQGQQVFVRREMNERSFQVKGNNLAPGVYILRMEFDKGTVMRKVMWK